jgi:hypothetical protein
MLSQALPQQFPFLVRRDVVFLHKSSAVLAMWQQRQLLGLIFVGVTLLLDTTVAVPPPTDYDTVFSYNLSSSVTPCRTWISPCLGGVYLCSSQDIYARSFVGPQPACPSLQNATATPPPGVCSPANDSCAFVPDAPTCVSWLSNCDHQYSCTTEEGFTAAVEEGQDCYPITPRPPSPSSVCIPANGSCEWYNPCRKWQGWCNGAYQCGTEEEYAFFVNGPQPLCVLPPENATQPVPAGECVYQDGQCAWSECVSWRSPCQTSWECGSDYEHRVAQSQPLPPCPAPPGQFVPPPEPGVCQISPESQSCEFLGEPECTGGQVYTTCGTLCPRTCENHQLDFACTSECVRGCFCPDDTVLHDGQCIPSWQCPGENPCYLVDCAPGYECLVYEATGEAYCSPNCEELNPCAPDELCVLTTVYCVRAPCPPILSCQGQCTGGREWQECGTACPLSCSNYTTEVVCTEQCVRGCFCPYRSYIHEDGCVPITECPGFINPCAYTDCAPGYECLVYEATGEAYCSPNCEELNPCAPDELCVLTTVYCVRAPCPPILSCQGQCTGGREWQECGTACPLSCSNYTTEVVCTVQCVQGCFCPYGSYIHEDGCVPITECPSYTSQCALILCPAGHVCVDDGTSDAYCDPSCDPAHHLCAEGERCELIDQDCHGRPSCPHAYRCTEECTGGKVWMECDIPLTCDNYNQPLPNDEPCVRGCSCCHSVELNGECIDASLCSECNSCKEGEVCSVVSESNGARYPICKGPTTVPCSGGSGEPHFPPCPEDYRCVTHNTTNIRYCLQSCYLENGGCPPEQVCYYERKDEDCNQLMEPCFKTACTDAPAEPESCPIGWVLNPCGSLCQRTCEDYVTGARLACPLVCGPPDCVCPQGLVVFRDRCVDPLECFSLLTNEPDLNPLPVPSDSVLLLVTLVNIDRGDVDGTQFAKDVEKLVKQLGFEDVSVSLFATLEAEDGSAV